MQAEGWSKEIQSTLVQFREAASRNDIATIAARNTLDHEAKWPTQEEALRLAIESYPKRVAALQAIEHVESEALDEDFLVRIGQAIYTPYSKAEMQVIIEQLCSKLGIVHGRVSAQDIVEQIEAQIPKRDKRPREEENNKVAGELEQQEDRQDKEPAKKKPAAKKKSSPLDCKGFFKLLRPRCIDPPQGLVEEAAADAACTSVQDILQIVLANGSLDQKTLEFKQMLLRGCFIAYCRKDHKTWEHIADRLNIRTIRAKSHATITQSHALYRLVVDHKMYKLRLLVPDKSILATLKQYAVNDMPRYLAAAANPEELEWWSQGPLPPTIQVDNGDGEMVETVDIRWLKG
jgi:hypothetical protein